MDYASRDLRDEHEGILHALDIIKKIVIKVKTGSLDDTEDITEIIDFFKVFADKCHHGKEEGLFFPAMEKAGIPSENGPIAQMLYEHVKGREYIAAMSDSVSVRPPRKDDFISAAQNYIGLLRSHIDKENNILFPLGDRKIREEVQQELLSDFNDFEEKVMGQGVHEKLHELLERFGKKYL